MVFQQRSRAAFGEIFPLEAFHDKQAVKALDKMGTCASIGFTDALVKAFGHATKAQREPSEHDSRGDEHPSDLGNHDDEQRKRSNKLGKHTRRRRHNRGGAGCHDTRHRSGGSSIRRCGQPARWKARHATLCRGISKSMKREFALKPLFGDSALNLLHQRTDAIQVENRIETISL